MLGTPRIDSENNNSNLSSCCDVLFDPKPFFTFEGTCFTTKAEVTETYPSLAMSIKIWLLMEENKSPGKMDKFSLI